MFETLFPLLVDLLYQYAIDYAIKWGTEKTIKWHVKKVNKGINDFLIHIGVDENEDGFIDENEVIATIKQFIPDLENGMCLCELGDEIGAGYPQFELIPSNEVSIYEPVDVVPAVGMMVDYDGDGDFDDPIVPIHFDFDGDGVSDWAALVDEDDDGLPEASPTAPFYPVGSPEFKQALNPSDLQIIMVSPDGELVVYDESGTITAEQCDTAYSLWLSENGIMDKPLDNYSVSEGLLFLMLLISAAYFVLHLFKRKDTYR